MVKIRIENGAASTSLGDELDLHSIALDLDRAEHEPEQFPGLLCRLKPPKTPIRRFRSGKVVCTGARKPADVEVAVQKITNELQGAGLPR